MFFLFTYNIYFKDYNKSAYHYHYSINSTYKL